MLITQIIDTNWDLGGDCTRLAAEQGANLSGGIVRGAQLRTTTPAVRPQPRHGRTGPAAGIRPLPDFFAADEELLVANEDLLVVGEEIFDVPLAAAVATVAAAMAAAVAAAVTAAAAVVVVATVAVAVAVAVVAVAPVAVAAAAAADGCGHDSGNSHRGGEMASSS